jgi:hypothetical protein
VTIDKAYWLRSKACPEWIKPEQLGPMEATHVIAVLHTKEWFSDQNHRQYRRFLDRCDHAFTLRAEGQSDLPVKITGGFVNNATDRGIFFEIPRAIHAKMKPGVKYDLIPINGKADVRWTVGREVALVVEEAPGER